MLILVHHLSTNLYFFMQKAVILLSGGLDSATCLALATKEGYECHTISFDYGQKQVCELNAAQKIAKQFHATNKIINLNSLGEIAKSALTDEDVAIPDHQVDPDNIPCTYVPARNTVFISFALAYAESLGADYIYIGASSIDYSGYPDCRPDYFEQFQRLINLATKVGVNGSTITIKTPLATLSKAETIKLGTDLGVNYADTITCYRANSQGQACGKCDSCHLRIKGFDDAGIKDPTLYTNS